MNLDISNMGTHLGDSLFTSREPDFLCCSSTATMPKDKKKPAGSKASSSQSVACPECEVYAARLWTVTNGGALLLPVATPPAGKDENLGAFWEVMHCGDRGGPPANKVRDL